MRDLDFFKPFLLSVVLTPLAILLVIASAGAGHGDYLGAKIIFPYTMIASLLYNLDAAPYFVNAFFWIVLPIIQFPLYGLLLSFASEKDWLRRLAVWLAVLHIVTATLNLLIHNERFG